MSAAVFDDHLMSSSHPCVASSEWIDIHFVIDLQLENIIAWSFQ